MIISGLHGTSNRAESRFAPSQWETALLCNDVSHWLCTNLEAALFQYECLAWKAHLKSADILTRADSGVVPNQWETALLCNDVSLWLDSALCTAIIATLSLVSSFLVIWCGPISLLYFGVCFSFHLSDQRSIHPFPPVPPEFCILWYIVSLTWVCVTPPIQSHMGCLCPGFTVCYHHIDSRLLLLTLLMLWPQYSRQTVSISWGLVRPGYHGVGLDIAIKNSVTYRNTHDMSCYWLSHLT